MFYFIVYEDYCDVLEQDFKSSKCIDEHPLTWYNKNQNIVLLNWKQISEEEFNMWEKE